MLLARTAPHAPYLARHTPHRAASLRRRLLHVGGALTSLRVDTGSVVRGNAALWAGGAVFGTMAVGAVEVAGGSSVSGNVAQEFGGGCACGRVWRLSCVRVFVCVSANP